ncbi:MAG: NYN domain-containing protein [Opitutales bacterium]
MHLIIDGYNVIHAWSRTRTLLRQGWAAAVAELARSVRVIHDEEGWQVTVVLDGKGERLSIEHPGGQNTFSLVYAPAGMAADTIIEQLVHRLPDPAQATVASRDNLVIETTAAHGATPISPDGLADWVERCAQSQTDGLLRRRTSLDQSWQSGTPWDKLETLFNPSKAKPTDPS